MEKFFKKLGRGILYSFGLIAVLLLGGFLFIQASIAVKAWGAAPEVRPAVRAVLWAGVWGDIFTWDDEMQVQMKIVKKLPQQARVEFFKTILLYGRIDGHRGCIFAEAAAEDAEALRQSLIDLKAGPQYNYLSESEKDRVDGWIKGLEPIIDDKTKQTSDLAEPEE